MLHLVTLSAVGEGENLPRENRGIFRVNVPPGVQQPKEKKCQQWFFTFLVNPSRSGSIQRGYFDSQVARPRRDKRLGVVWELRADGFCTISSHFLLSVRCRMSITGKSLPRRRQRKEEQESNKGRRRKKRKKMFPAQLCDVHDVLPFPSDGRACGGCYDTGGRSQMTSVKFSGFLTPPVQYQIHATSLPLVRNWPTPSPLSV